ncbi:hypothetical protein IQ268_05970 [Oculatella sp. LEGE 06141]|uniref:hypothetical protein n=1 Tax=Oculatella sp. LEGE 06141 TaxID=1828648 RepID=UPI0018809D49|nr:hypothetical protein [Oculatella sp. LEGE 06141]MBE9178133.1 hypothetical protein [Oculatella sp. LEGE 06141]
MVSLTERRAGDNGSQAGVMGGGMAELLPPRPLLNHFDPVTAVERDRLSSSAALRMGVPHAQLDGRLFLARIRRLKSSVSVPLGDMQL